MKTVFTYLENHILLSLTARKIQGQKAHPQDLQMVMQRLGDTPCCQDGQDMQEEKTIYFSSDSAS